MGNPRNSLKCSTCAKARISYHKIKCGSTNEEANDLFRIWGSAAAEKCDSYKSLLINESGKLNLDSAMRFMLAGQAEFDIVSGKTGRKIFYKIDKRETLVTNLSNEDNQYIYWVSGGDSPENIEFLGTIYFNKQAKSFQFSRGTRGKGTTNKTEVKAILFVLNKLYQGKYNLNIEINHLGRCGKCGMRLTDIQSVTTGIGLNCEKHVKNPDLE